MLFDVRRRVQHVMMIVPKDADIQEAERVGEKDWQPRREGGQIRPGRRFDSSTMIVMMMAITPSVNASRRLFPWRDAFRIGRCGDASGQLGIQRDLGVENL